MKCQETLPVCAALLSAQGIVVHPYVYNRVARSNELVDGQHPARRPSQEQAHMYFATTGYTVYIRV